jgi:hypothetical protein
MIMPHHATCLHGARVSTEVYARGCHWFPRLKRAGVQPMTFLSGVHFSNHFSYRFTTVNCVQTLKANMVQSKQAEHVLFTVDAGGLDARSSFSVTGFHSRTPLSVVCPPSPTDKTCQLEDWGLSQAYVRSNSMPFGRPLSYRLIKFFLPVSS